MGLKNSNNSSIVNIPLGSLTDDNVLPALYANKDMKILSAEIINGAAIAASDTDYCIVKILNGAEEVASLDTRAAAQNGLEDKVAKAMELVADQSDIAAGSTLTVDYDEEGTIALTDAILSVNLHQK